MHGWAEDLLGLIPKEAAEHERTVFSRIESAGRALGFDYCAYGLQLPLPLTKPRVLMLNNYSEAWRVRYDAARYIEIDPTVQHGRRSAAPLVWSGKTFPQTPQFWEDARAHGLEVGWAQSCRDSYGLGGMLTLARSGEPLTQAELLQSESKMRWLANVAHLSLACVLKGRLCSGEDAALTPREVEILKWHADGKTLQEISDILVVSVETVKFHTRNAMLKLGAANKTAAVVRAAVLGLLC
ncbi:LuxR family transcriptional regulator [Burkholderia sp. Bp8963]|uniref:LuxR family transcriptional regulator n=1 Tax=Burkholderia sp. Bp8963 TaxID=2184547 RepID=UPI000F5A9440|nr:LuxR family transcriptional regulator [Burkholderia sp. Bp8963]RQS64133.1 LuxR family transcriptional regulator [Burkholderia sp. Bp8963]